MASREWLNLEAMQVPVKMGNQGFTALVQTTRPEEHRVGNLSVKVQLSR